MSEKNPFISLKILSTGIALPSCRIDSDEIDKKLNRAIGYTEKRFGITCRYHADYTMDSTQLAVEALEKALSEGIDPDSIDLLIYASAIPIQMLPYSAAQVLKKSSLRSGTASMDINTSCVSFVTALHTAGCLLAAGAYRRIAIVSSELASRGIDWEHEESSLIFGDGAACAIVEKGISESGILAYRSETYPEGSDFCEIRAGGTRRNPRAGMDEKDFLFQMQGKPLFRLAASLMEVFLNRLLESAGLTLQDITTVIPHQASHLSLEHIRKRLGVAPETVVDIYRKFGNQVSASVPTALHEAVTTGRWEPNRPVLLLGTAAGLTLTGMILLP